MRIFKFGAELQIFVYNNGITFKISRLIVGLILRFVLDRKVTLRTICTYEQYLQTLFMERRPVTLHCEVKATCKVNTNKDVTVTQQSYAYSTHFYQFMSLSLNSVT